MPVPYTFGTATAAIPLSQLDSNFATAITLGNTAVYLGNTTTSLGNVTLTNVTISSGNVTITGANVSGTANVSTLIITGNQTSLGNVSITGNVSANIATFGAGSNTAPAITTTGDTNTGIFFPAADTIAFAEGGVESVRFNSSGVFTTTNDATIQGLTVGRGAGAVASNTAVGASALAANTSGTYNSAVGYQSSQSIQGGGGNVSFGGLALRLNVSGDSNAAFGVNALESNTGSNNTGIGRQALGSNTTASNNTAVGYQAGYSNTTGAGLTTFGYKAGYANTTSNLGTYFGAEAGTNTTGASNAFFGYAAGYLVTSGTKNTIIGAYSGNQGGLDIRTASNNIVLSDGDGNPRFYVDSSGNLFAGTSNISFSINSTGGYSRFGSINATNVLQVSYNSTSSGVSLTSAATSWGTFSDQRLKNVTGVYENALADIAQIEPIKFTWKSDESNKPCVGVLAHTVKAVVPEAVEEVANSMEDETLYLQVRYTELIPLMIASIKELKAEIDALKGASA